MSTSLKVRFSYPRPAEPPAQAYTLIVEIYEAVGIPKEVFVFQIDAYPGAGDGTDTDSVGFVKVASVIDLEEYPVRTADMANEIPYFRMERVILSFRDLTTLFETKQLIYNDINELVRSRRVQDTVPVQEDVTFDGSQTSTDIPWDSSTLLK